MTRRGARRPGNARSLKVLCSTEYKTARIRIMRDKLYDSPGLILIPRSMPIGRVIDEIQLVWQVCEAEEWINLFRRFPL